MVRISTLLIICTGIFLAPKLNDSFDVKYIDSYHQRFGYLRGSLLSIHEYVLCFSKVHANPFRDTGACAPSLRHNTGCGTCNLLQYSCTLDSSEVNNFSKCANLRLRGGFLDSSNKKRNRKRSRRTELLQPSTSKERRIAKLPPSLQASGYQGPINIDAVRRGRASGNYESQERRRADEDSTPGQPQARNWLGKKLREIKKSKQVHGILSRLRTKAAKEMASIYNSTGFVNDGNPSFVPSLSGVPLQESWPHKEVPTSNSSRLARLSSSPIKMGAGNPSPLKQTRLVESLDENSSVCTQNVRTRPSFAGASGPSEKHTTKGLPAEAQLNNSSDERRGRGANWLLSAYEKRRAEIDAQRAAASAARDARTKAKAAALEERRRWRKRLGARTRTGQPVMEHIVERLMVQMHRSDRRAAAAAAAVDRSQHAQPLLPAQPTAVPEPKAA